VAFIITEIAEAGAVPGGPARFEWTTENRAIPERPWTFGTAVRHKRTDYAGGDEPTIQVFGPNGKPQQLTGRWDDRFGGPGFARGQRRAFNDLVRRTNKVRIEFQGLAWTGMIVDVDYPYDFDSKIGYSFTFEPMVEEDAAPLRTTDNTNRPMSVTAIVADVAAALDDISRTLRGVDPDTGLPLPEVPKPALALDSRSALDATLDDIDAAFAEIDAVRQQRLVAPGEEARLSVMRCAQLFGQMRSQVTRTLDVLVTWRSDAQLATRTAKDSLNFDDFRTSLGFQLRLLGLRCFNSQRELERRAEPSADAIYVPREGEHLYSISLKFFGTKDQWRSIMLRNHLAGPVMTGDELLVIPGAGDAVTA
jgi:hypothetical protein